MSANLHTKPWIIALSLALCSAVISILILFRPATASVDGRGMWHPADSDVDGMSDQWEAHYFGAATARAGGEDDDLDSLTTLDEWLAGSDPLKLDAKSVGEIGDVVVAQPDGDYWHKVRLDGVYQNPVVIMGPPRVEGAKGGPLPVRVRNVGAKDFEFQFDRFEYLANDWDNGDHRVAWMVMEAGRFDLGDGLDLESGNHSVDSGGSRVTFSQPFTVTPVILAQVTTRNGWRATTTRVWNVGVDGFDVVLQGQEANQVHEEAETVSWMAIEPGFLRDEFGRRQAGLIDGVTHEWTTLTYPERFFENPAFLATVQTKRGADTVTLRHKNLGQFDVLLRMAEDQSADSETAHTAEKVGWFAAQERGMLHILPSPGDQDADGMPDAWEALNGLTGSVDGTKGYYGDFDHDGITNGIEYLKGTRANLADTDSDGVGDYDEIFFYESDALATDVGAFDPVYTINGSSFVAPWGDWQAQGNSGVLNGPRGSVDYQMPVVDAGIHSLDINYTVTAGGDLSASHQFVVMVDGAFVSRVNTGGRYGGSFRALTPWLDTGNHTVRVLWDNTFVQRRIGVDSLLVSRATGVDSDTNQVPDWVDIRISRQNGVGQTGSEGVEPLRTSRVSPLCVEGRSRYLSLSAATSDVSLNEGPNGTWFADVELDPDTDVLVDYTFENGALLQSQSYRWEATNLMAESGIQVRQGDSLRLAGWISGKNINPSHQVDLVIEGQEFLNVPATEPLVYQFNTPGVHEIQAVFRNGNANGNSNGTYKSVLVNVASRAVPESPLCAVGYERPWLVTGLDEQAIVQIDENVAVYDGARVGTDGYSYTIAMTTPETRHAYVRLGSGGPVLSTVPIRCTRVATNVQTGLFGSQSLGDGSFILEMPVFVGGAWDDLSVEIDILRAGVTYLDGSTTLTLLGVEIDEFGFAVLKFLVPNENSTNCHRVAIYQNGVRIAYFN